MSKDKLPEDRPSVRKTYTKRVTDADIEKSESSLKEIHGEGSVAKVPNEVRIALGQLTKFQRMYCEYRSKGLSQAKAAKKAGSNANDLGLARVGYNVECKAYAKTYLEWLTSARATYAMIDDVEIIENARAIYAAAFEAGKYADALKASELLANLAGLLKKGGELTNTKTMRAKTKNNVGAFKEEDVSHATRAKQLSGILKQVIKD